MIKISQDIIDRIKSHAKKEVPIEACGYLAGKNGEISESFPMSNIDKSPEHFSFDPKEQFKVIKAARAKGLELIVVYHSHPASPARLSKEDLRLAYDPNTIHLIYSLLNQEIKAFKVVNGDIKEEAIEVLS